MSICTKTLCSKVQIIKMKVFISGFLVMLALLVWSSSCDAHTYQADRFMKASSRFVGSKDTIFVSY